MHDLRHGFANYAASMSEILALIDKLLTHTNEAMAARYSHRVHFDEIEVWERIGEVVLRAKRGGSLMRQAV